MNHDHLKIEESNQLPNQANSNTVYVLPPVNFSRNYYNERTDRNIGWISREEQEMLRGSTVGIAGTGGMGGLIAATLVRLGVGTVKIADCEEFDVSNINRQFAATKNTVGISKAFATAHMIRDIADDTTLVVYPQGITEETVDHFLDGCDIVCDEIEFWATGARVLLHQQARALRIPMINCDTVGHRTYLFYFTHDGMPIEEALGFDYAEAKYLQERAQKGTATALEKRKVMDAIIKVFMPEVPEYSLNTNLFSNQKNWDERLFNEGKAMIIPTNPPMASGFTANHVLFQLLKQSNIQRTIHDLPKMPGYIMFDAAHMQTDRVEETWW